MSQSLPQLSGRRKQRRERGPLPWCQPFRPRDSCPQACPRQTLFAAVSGYRCIDPSASRRHIEQRAILLDHAPVIAVREGGRIGSHELRQMDDRLGKCGPLAGQSIIRDAGKLDEVIGQNRVKNRPHDQIQRRFFLHRCRVELHGANLYDLAMLPRLRPATRHRSLPSGVFGIEDDHRAAFRQTE